MSSRIWAWIVTSSAVVGSSAMSSFGFGRQRHGDHHALAHAARQLVRVLAWRARLASGMPTRREHLDRPVQASRGSTGGVQLDRLGDLVADGVDRVERGHRLLEDHA